MDDPRAKRPSAEAARFEDQGELARGGMAVVRALWDRLLGRRVALKELVDDSAADTAAAFLEEARIMGGLDHPNILPVYDLQADGPGGTARLLMKLVDGRTLSDLLHASPEPPSGLQLERLLDVILKVCDAVSFARPTCSVVVTDVGESRRRSGMSGFMIAYAVLYHFVADRTPCIGIISPGRNMYAALNPQCSNAFSVRPFTRAHMTRPRSVLSVLAPDT